MVVEQSDHLLSEEIDSHAFDKRALAAVLPLRVLDESIFVEASGVISELRGLTHELLDFFAVDPDAEFACRVGEHDLVDEFAKGEGVECIFLLSAIELFAHFVAVELFESGAQAIKVAFKHLRV